MAENIVNIQADIEAVGRIEAVDSILEIICRSTGMGFAAVARVTDTSWVACAVRDEIDFGLLPGGELTLETTICHEIRQNHKSVVIDHVKEDPEFAAHHTPAMYGFQSYISVPIFKKNGVFFGTLCAIDPSPANLKHSEIPAMFKMFAELIAFHLDAIEKLALSELRLREEQQTAELREQFIAILGHDLRNPIGAITNAAQLLVRKDPDDLTKKLTTIIQNSSYRMKGLIDNILDFARGRLGSGIVATYGEQGKIGDILDQVVTELRMVWPSRLIETDYRIALPVMCDETRMSQLFSNLLSNALSHGDAAYPVKIQAYTKDDEFYLSTVNRGEPISEATKARLFQPFYRGEVKAGQEGLGLGLYICAEIAAAHSGTLEVTSTSDQTCFTLKMPVSKTA
ncbi:MAG: GAF domain-containing sensor histidine kinase [Pedobacter sp.]